MFFSIIAHFIPKINRFGGVVDFFLRIRYNEIRNHEGVLMSVLYFFESIRNPVLDFIMSTVTHLGEEMILVALALVFLWCLDKREGYYLLTVSFAGLVVPYNIFISVL